MIKSNHIKIVLSMLVVAHTLHAMEGSKKKYKGEEHPELGGSEPMEMGTEEEPQVKLISSEGKEFVLPISVAQLSGSLAGLLEYPELGMVQGLEFKLSEVSAFNLNIIIPLMIQLDQLKQQNERADIMDKIYIPREFQPFIHAKLKGLSDKQIGDLSKAVEFLDVPFILNGIASIIADRIGNEITAKAWLNLLLSARKAEVANLVERFGITADQNQDYILQHVLFRMKGISQEYSIADYIREHGQPELLVLDGLNRIELRKNNLTSLFGIELIAQKDRVENLDISDSCLGDLSLDLQLPMQPLSEFVNLQKLSLQSNQLNNLPEEVFAGLVNLQELRLMGNKLNNLPEHLFAGLMNLRELGLFANHLSNLPERIFADLMNLRELNLSSNQLNNLPERVFAGLLNLRELSLARNQLNNLPERIFAGLVNLQELSLSKNQLSNLPKGVFAGLVKLQELLLSGNELNEQDKQNIRETLLHTEIKF